jgi:hypothetical protein
MLASMRALLVAVLLVLAPQAPSKEAPVRKLDRTKAVGAPVLDEKAAEGIYVWLEDGWFNVAAVAHPKKRKKQMSVTVRASKSIDKAEGDFARRAQGGGIAFRAPVGALPVKGRFKTDGEITVSTAHALFVGPLSRKAASPLSIGRY